MERDTTKVLLDPDEMPTRWYNLLPRLPRPPPPPIHPATREPIGPEALAPLFPMELIRQEVSTDAFVPIPEEVREAYLRLGRPTPLYRAKRLEAALKTPAKIFYKREDLSPTGSHKPNTAIAQAYYAMREGVERYTTETGAGQWGSALALATAYFGLGCSVFMVRVSYDQKPYRKHVMQLFGADVFPSPSDRTAFGRKLLADDGNNPGSLGIAISEALEMAAQDDGTKYSLGSVLNHVLLHQSIIGQELLAQFALLDLTPDYVVSNVGGGSNFAGLAYPAIGRRLKGETDTRFVAVEPTSIPSMTRGKYDYDFGDTAGTTPLLKMLTLGHEFVPPRIHAGGLRYHGCAPSLSALVDAGVVEPVAYDQQATFDAGALFARTEGIVPAPETSHGIKGAIELAKAAKATGESPVIALNLSGHGLLDLEGYAHYLAGTLRET
jgi:tryptophan synthase beta chain